MNHFDHFKAQAISLDTLVEAGLLEKAEDGKYRPGTQRRSQQQPESALSRQIDDLQKQMKDGKVLPAAEKRQAIAAPIKPAPAKLTSAKAVPAKPAPVKASTAKAGDVDLNAVTSMF
jgi:hypothetical protein